MPPTVAGVVTDKSGHTAAWSTSWTIVGGLRPSLTAYPGAAVYPGA